jgi:hypothetical protein
MILRRLLPAATFCAALAVVGHGRVPGLAFSFAENPSAPPPAAKKPACCKNQVVIFHGFDMPVVAGKQLMNASDPDLVKIDNQWVLFFTSAVKGPKMKNTLWEAGLPKGAGLDSAPAAWKISPEPLVEHVPDAWDSQGFETASYVYGYDNTAKRWEARIYYTGYANYAELKIGYLRWNQATSRWERSGGPVVEATTEWEFLKGKSLIGDMAVVYVPGPGRGGKGGMWHMYYNAVNDKTAVVIHVVSTDGRQWTNKRIALEGRGYYPDFALIKKRYELVGITFEPERAGLWWSTSTTPDGTAPEDWKTWYPLVYTLDGTPWHFHKLIGATFAWEKGKFWVFYSSWDENKTGDSYIGRAECDLPLK